MEKNENLARASLYGACISAIFWAVFMILVLGSNYFALWIMITFIVFSILGLATGIYSLILKRTRLATIGVIIAAAVIFLYMVVAPVWMLLIQ